MMWFYSNVLAACCLLGQVCATCESGNCTEGFDESVEKVELVERSGSNAAKLAWLLTPAVLGLGVMFLIYKCCKDGLCNCRRLRQRAVLEYHREHGYIPLSQVVLHTTEASGQAPDLNNLPPLPPGLRRHLVVIHNQTFCITLRDPPPGSGEGCEGGCPGNEQCIQGVPNTAEGGVGSGGAPPYDHVCCPAAAAAEGGEGGEQQGPLSQPPPPVPPAIVVKPPTYEEATDGPSGGRPPRYSEACGEGLPDPDTAVTPEPEQKLPPTRQVRFDTTTTSSTTTTTTTSSRRRHFSAQERRILEQLLASATEDGSGDNLRQRCFSFNALRDAFGHNRRRHSSSNNTERQILLQQQTTTEVFTAAPPSGEDDDSVFLSVELLGPPPAGPLPENVTVLSGPEDLDLAGLLSQPLRHRHASGPPTERGYTITGTRARQRHASAPDPSRKSTSRSRHSSGH